MAQRDYFAHISPRGDSGRPDPAAGYQALLCGENIASGTAPLKSVQAWMDQSSHRANILEARYRDIGLA